MPPSAPKDPRLAKLGVQGYNMPKRTPGHPTKSHVVVAKVGDKARTADKDIYKKARGK